MSEFILKEEPFSFGILDRVPVPNDDECFLLYQVGAEKKGSIVISSGGRYSSAEIRHGHYNRKVTISLKNKNITQSRQIAMKNRDLRFDVTVKVSYALREGCKRLFLF